MTDARQCYTPTSELIERINRHLRGWASYYRLGYPRKAFRCINAHVQQRLVRHLNRRSQRGWRPPKGFSLYAHIYQLGLLRL